MKAYRIWHQCLPTYHKGPFAWTKNTKNEMMLKFCGDLNISILDKVSRFNYFERISQLETLVKNDALEHGR